MISSVNFSFKSGGSTNPAPEVSELQENLKPYVPDF